MRGLQLERPPRGGVLALVGLVLVNVAVLAGMALRPAAPDAYGATRIAAATASAAQAERAAAPAEPSASAVAARSPRLAVYGDGYAAGNDSGGLGPAGWPAQVAARLGADLALHAVARAGYASVGVSGQNLAQVVQANPVPEAAVTVLFGSRNDRGEPPAAIQANAAQAIAVVQSQAPGSAVVVIGPVWDDADVPADVSAARDAVQAAAQAGGVSFVDPLTEQWLAGRPSLIAADGVSPNDAGHVHLAQSIAPVVQAALAAGATRVAG